MQTYVLDAGIPCLMRPALSLPTKFRGPRVVAMAAVMGKLGALLFTLIEESKVNPGFTEEKAALWLTFTLYSDKHRPQPTPRETHCTW